VDELEGSQVAWEEGKVDLWGSGNLGSLGDEGEREMVICNPTLWGIMGVVSIPGVMGLPHLMVWKVFPCVMIKKKETVTFDS
jgi:hypothetical protein